MGKILELHADGIRVLPERLDQAAEWDAAGLDEVDQAVERAVTTLNKLGTVPIQHPWFGTLGDRSTLVIEQRLRTLEESRKQLKEVFNLRDQADALLKIEPERSLAAVRIAIQLLNALASVPVRGRENLKGEVWRTERPRIEELCKSGKLWCSSRAELDPVLAENAWSTETASTREAIAKIGGSWLRFFSGKYRRATTDLRALYKQAPPRKRGEQLATLDKLFSAQLARTKVTEDSELGRMAVGPHWADTKTDWEMVDHLLSWSNATAQLDPALIEPAADVDDQLCGVLARNLQAAVDAFLAAFVEVTKCARPDFQILFAAADLEQADLNAVSSAIDRWIIRVFRCMGPGTRVDEES